MRQTLKTMATIAFARAIAEKGIEACDPEMVDERKLYRDMGDQAMVTMKVWPDKITQKDIRKISRTLGEFCTATGWEKGGQHIQTHLNFSLSLLERLKDELKDAGACADKVLAIDALLDAEMAVYRRFSSGRDREYPLCLLSGLKAAAVWNGIMAK